MAIEFIGSTVLVTMHSPPGTQVRGVVLDISNQMLFLGEVFWLASGHLTPKMQIASSNLADLEVLPEAAYDSQPELQARAGQGHGRPISPPQAEVNDSVPSSLRGSFSQPDPILAEQSQASNLANASSALPFHDPAILSTVRPKDTHGRLAGASSRPPPPAISQKLPDDAVQGSSAKPGPSLHESHVKKPHRSTLARMDSLATLSEPFDDLSIEKSQDDPESEAVELGTDGGKDQAAMGDAGSAIKGGRRQRKSAKSRRNQMQTSLLAHAEEADSSPVNLKSQTPITRRKAAKLEGSVEEVDLVAVEDHGFLSGKKLKKSIAKTKRRDGLKVTEAVNGWATEDATDIQELGDFDFLANHAKFDKKEIFKQMKLDDNTAEELRLVSHNRRSKPGTRGGRDLHWSENVLDVPHVVSSGVTKWNSEAGESDEDASETRLSSGRDSRPGGSHQSALLAASRKSSYKAAETRAPSNGNTGTSAGQSTRPTIAATLNRLPNLDASSPRLKSQPASSPYLASVPSSRPTLRLQGTNKSCSTLSPLQMLEYEQFAITEMGLTEEILAENAARGIAQVAITVLRDSNKNSSFLKSHIVVATGNHRSGARALASARHLHCHGFRVTATVMGHDRDEDLLDSVRQQMQAFRKAGGTVVKAAALLTSLKAGAGNILPNLLIDALLGIHTIFDDLRGDDQAWYYELVLLVNRNEWRVLSVDVPSGLDAVTGEISHTEAAPSQALAFFPTAVISLGAPKPWVLATLRETPANTDNGEPALYVADIGISNVVWKRLGNRRSKGIEFAEEWVRRLRYQPSGE